MPNRTRINEKKYSEDIIVIRKIKCGKNSFLQLFLLSMYFDMGIISTDYLEMKDPLSQPRAQSGFDSGHHFRINIRK